MRRVPARAGGLGFAFRTALGAELVSGTDLVLQTIGASKNLSDADLFITGEGRLDSQTARGKAPAGAARFLKRLNPKCVAVELCGSIGERPETIHALGIDAFFPIIGGPATEAAAMDPDAAKDNLRRTAAEAVRFFTAARAAPGLIEPDSDGSQTAICAITFRYRTASPRSGRCSGSFEAIRSSLPETPAGK